MVCSDSAKMSGCVVVVDIGSSRDIRGKIVGYTGKMMKEENAWNPRKGDQNIKYDFQVSVVCQSGADSQVMEVEWLRCAEMVGRKAGRIFSWWAMCGHPAT